MFNNLTKKLSSIFQHIIHQGRLTEKNIKNTIREVRKAFLEADVALPVVKKIILKIKKIAIGKKINKSLSPGQEFIKIVKNQLIDIMGKKEKSLNLSINPPAVIMVSGIQGSGKTTSLIKLGRFIKKKYKKKILCVSTDTIRPAAINQLQILSEKEKIDFFPSKKQEDPIKIAKKSLNHAKLHLYDVLLVDTAGRSNIEKKMMQQIQKIQNTINPIETFFVIDAMIGQNSINVIKKFKKEINISGTILTKIDGDARGGVALSVLEITKKPIKFIGTGEKIENFEIFNPEKITKRILGMGDVISLIEKIEKKAQKLRIQKNTLTSKENKFTLNDFLAQINQINNMGGVRTLIQKLPLMYQKNQLVQSYQEEKNLVKIKAIIQSMTEKERNEPKIIKGNRKKRISIGSGTKIQDINQVLKQFLTMKKMVKKIKNNGIRKTFQNIKNMFQ